MEFTVAEQLALLAIKPNGGWFISESRVATLLAAGAIAELLVEGHIEVTDGVIHRSEPAPSAFLEDIQSKVDGQPITTNKALAATGGKTTLNAVYRRLADRSLVKQDTGWWARWRLTSGQEDDTSGSVGDDSPANELASDLRAALIAGQLSPRGRLTIQLLDAARLLGWVKVPRAELDAARESLRPRPWIAEALQRRLSTQSFRV